MPRPLISFCTACMDRLHHLQQTLPRNLADNRDHDRLEFVLLDYNSSDGLEDWVGEHLTEALQSGRLRVFRTTEPEAFHHSHARNLAFRLANGEILCNVDADNFTGPGFARYVEQRFAATEQAFLAVDRELQDRFPASFGRICVRRRHFLESAGYDEAMAGYGWEDIDFCARLEALGLEFLSIKDERYLRYLDHDQQERVRKTVVNEEILEIYRGERPEWPETYRFVLRKNGTFRRFGLPPEIPLKFGEWSRAPDGDRLHLRWLEGREETLHRQGDHCYLLETPEGPFLLERITDQASRLELVYELSWVENEAVYRRNLESGAPVNPDGFGRGEVRAGCRRESV